MIQKPTWLLNICKVEILQNVFSWMHRKYEDSYVTYFFPFNKHLPIFKCLSNFNDKNRYIVCIKDNIDN